MHHETHALFHLFGLEVTARVTTMWGIMALLIIVSFLATRNLQVRRPSGIQNVMELVVEGLLNFFGDTLGYERARRFLPYFATFFMFILLCNYSGLLPGVFSGDVPGVSAPTNTWSVTAAWAVIVFFTTQYFGIRYKGLNYFKHFTKPMFFMLPLNILEELIKPLSLSLRLFGNIFGEEMVLAVILSIVPYFVPIPLWALFVLLSLVQAFVFTLLAVFYLDIAISEEH